MLEAADPLATRRPANGSGSSCRGGSSWPPFVAGRCGTSLATNRLGPGAGLLRREAGGPLERLQPGQYVPAGRRLHRGSDVDGTPQRLGLRHLPVTRDPLQRANGVDIERVRRSEEHTSELQSLRHLVCRLLLEKKKK